MLFLVGVFAELNESAGRGLGMNESDIEAFGAFAGSFVYYAAAFFFYLGKSVGNSVLYSECYVLDAAAAPVFLYEFGYGAFGRGGLEKLYFGLAYLEEGCAYFLVGYFFNCKAFETKKIFVKRNGFVK